QYTAHLTTHEGLDCTVMPSTVRVDDKASKKPFTASDDGKGTISGPPVAKGSVDYYESQNVALEFKQGSEPDAPENLDITYRFRGNLNNSIRVYAHHAYVFDKVESGKIFLKNPWGVKDPTRGISAAEFKSYFTGIDSNEVKQDKGKP